MNGRKVWREAGVMVALPLMLAGCGGGGGSSSGGDTAPAAAVAGQIDIEANTRVDLDTAEKLSVSSGSLGISSPQVLPGSVILGGYVSGEAGSRNTSDPNDNYSADPVDRYQLTLSAGDRIELQTFYTYYNDASGSAVEANFPVSLKLVNPSDGSVVTGTTTQTTSPNTQVYSVSIDVPVGTATGRYYVDVEADSGPMRYVLTTSPSGGVTSLSFDWPRYEFAQDEALVTLSGGASAQAMSATLSASPVRELGQGTWLMRREVAQARSGGHSPEQTTQWIQALRAQPGVASAVPNYVVKAHLPGSPSPSPDPLYPKQWHYPLINVPAAWQLAPGGGSGVTVAVVDTGLFRDANTKAWHPDLNANVSAAGYDFVSQNDLDNDTANTGLYGQIGRDSIPADPGSSLGTNVFHGTHVAGTIAAYKGNGKGGTGVAFNATLLPVRVLGEGGSGALGDLVDGLNWIADQNNANIVNLSLGGLPYVSSLETALKRLSDRGITTVAAAGNSARSTKEYPAASQYAIAVSAVDGAGNLAPYSNFGSWIDVAAPGGSAADANLDGSPDLVLSTSATLGDSGQFEPSYRGLVGTSMAAPHVSGVFALMQDASSTAISPGQFRAWLMAGELTQGGDGTRNDQFGYGLIDAAKAVSTALGSPSVTVLSPDPYYVSLNNQKTQEVVTLTKVGDPMKNVTGCSIAAKPMWLTANCDDTVDPATLTVTLTDPSTLNPDAPLKGSVSVTYTTDTTRSLTVPVTAQVVTDATERDAGVQFVLLVQTEPDAQGNYITEAQDVVQVENGQYTFRFRHDDGAGTQEVDEVRPGSYYLVAGTDLDNDGFICQPGEACAEYPVSGLRQVVQVTADTDLTNLRMTTGFSRPTISAATPDVLPRPDFAGYRLLERDDPGVKQLSGGRP